MTTLKHLAQLAGLDPDYTSWRGEATSSSEGSLLAVLQAMSNDLGIQIATSEDARGAVTALERERWNEIVPPVVIGWDGALVVPMSVPANSDGDWEVAVTTEAGRTVTAHGKLFDLPADSHASPDGIVHCVRRARIELDGELGYHRVEWRVTAAAAPMVGASLDAGRSKGESLGICAPTRAYGGPGEGARRWGVFAPVYGLANAQSGQAGDLANLRELFHAVGRRGGHYVATLPILAAFLGEPYALSPYSPASRCFWNELYLDLGGLAGEAEMPAPVAPPIVADTLIDFREQYRWRRRALDPIAARLIARRGPEIDAWARATGVYDYAAFRAFGERTRTSWPSWPAMWREGVPMIDSRADALALGLSTDEAGALDTHVVAQWAMQRQLEALARSQPGVHLYLDLPVGVSCDAYEVWRHRHLFLTTLAAGAPPDPLFLGGQDWGLPPLSPIAARRDRYRYVIRCVRHHMKVSGMLRIDHVMGLFRLYIVPQGRPATDGVYLRYPADEMLAILTLESHRNRCALVGEDLGTVPDFVRPAMARHGMFRLHVAQWSMPSRVGERPGAAPSESVASLDTHDTATFAGWWRGSDIDDRTDLGLITADQDREERVGREATRLALLSFARGGDGGMADDRLTDVERAMVATTADLANGSAEVVLVALDDLVLDPVPHNVPGTVDERPNWRRRVQGWADSLDEMRASPAAAEAMSAVVAARKG